jgi:hypothetical protein
MYTFTFFSDPGHGWLEVPISLLCKLGIADKITPYSYMRGDKAYLEEDCDFGAFLRAAKAAGWKVEIREQVQRYGDSPIRNYLSYSIIGQIQKHKNYHQRA